jgi:hypothetical protein
MGEIRYRNRRAVRIENDEIAVTVSVEGGHIAELLDKKSGVNPLWTPPWPSIEPSTYDAARHPEYGANSESQLLAGILGHNLALDLFGAPSAEEFQAGVGVHGEVNVVEHQIEATGISLRASAHLPLAQLDFVREISLEPGGVARIRETVRNLTALDRPLAWTQHVTLGPPFLEAGVTQLHLPARRSITYPTNLSDQQKYAVWREFDWPHAPHKDGSSIDLRVMPGYEKSAGVTGHLVDADREQGFFVAWHPRMKVLAGYAWSRADFPWIALWEENRSRDQPPWNGETITRGVEFGVSPFAEARRSMVERGSVFGTPVYRWLPALGVATAEYVAFVRSSDAMPEEPPVG